MLIILTYTSRPNLVHSENSREDSPQTEREDIITHKKELCKMSLKNIPLLMKGTLDRKFSRCYSDSLALLPVSDNARLFNSLTSRHRSCSSTSFFFSS